MKGKLKEWKEVLVMVAILFGAWLFIDERYVHAGDGARIHTRIEAESKKTHTQIQRQIIVNELKRYDAKELEGVKLKTWERLDQKSLQQTLQEMTK